MFAEHRLQSMLVSGWTHARKIPLVVSLTRVLSVVWQLLLPFLKTWFGRTLSRPPAIPSLEIVDARCNRVKVDINCPSTSPFNDDEYQIAYSTKPDDPSVEASWSELTWKSYAHRVIPQISGRCEYLFRARARNAKGCSAWGAAMSAVTLIEPTSGGATCDGYTWTQTGIETSIRVDVPAEVKAKHVTVALRPEHLSVSYTLEGTTEQLIEGVLPHRVRLLSPDGGSYWEIDRESKKSAIIVVLEKEKPAANIKWGFWRSMFVGQPEIDTHAILSDPYVKPSQPSPGTPGTAGFDMKTVARSEYEALRKRLGHTVPPK